MVFNLDKVLVGQSSTDNILVSSSASLRDPLEQVGKKVETNFDGLADQVFIAFDENRINVPRNKCFTTADLRTAVTNHVGLEPLCLEAEQLGKLSAVFSHVLVLPAANNQIDIYCLSQTGIELSGYRIERDSSLGVQRSWFDLYYNFQEQFADYKRYVVEHPHHKALLDGINVSRIKPSEIILLPTDSKRLSQHHLDSLPCSNQTAKIFGALLDSQPCSTSEVPLRNRDFAAVYLQVEQAIKENLWVPANSPLGMNDATARQEIEKFLSGLDTDSVNALTASRRTLRDYHSVSTNPELKNLGREYCFFIDLMHRDEKLMEIVALADNKTQALASYFGCSTKAIEYVRRCHLDEENFSYLNSDETINLAKLKDFFQFIHNLKSYSTVIDTSAQANDQELKLVELSYMLCSKRIWHKTSEVLVIQPAGYALIDFVDLGGLLSNDWRNKGDNQLNGPSVGEQFQNVVRLLEDVKDKFYLDEEVPLNVVLQKIKNDLCQREDFTIHNLLKLSNEWPTHRDYLPQNVVYGVSFTSPYQSFSVRVGDYSVRSLVNDSALINQGIALYQCIGGLGGKVVENEGNLFAFSLDDPRTRKPLYSFSLKVERNKDQQHEFQLVEHGGVDNRVDSDGSKLRSINLLINELNRAPQEYIGALLVENQERVKLYKSLSRTSDETRPLLAGTWFETLRNVMSHRLGIALRSISFHEFANVEI